MKTFKNRSHGQPLSSCKPPEDFRCLVAPHPDLAKKILANLAKARGKTTNAAARMLREQRRKPVGMDDGLIYPGDYFPLGTSARAVRSAALDRAPLRGSLRVVVVLVDFSDKKMTATKKHFEDLFFSTGTLAGGSVRDYFREVSHSLVDIVGEVVGPFRMPKKLSQYANGDSGTGTALPNARTMAHDAAIASNPSVDFGPYDNDGDGFVDAFIVVHAGPGAEVTGSANDIWSHKWVLDGGAYNADGTKIYGYLTVPEDSKIGVCSHELGHLLFGWPDLYDTDSSSEGLGNWCLMAGGSWNGGGNTPAHPSAWCKMTQGWVSVVNQNTNQNLTIGDVKTDHKIYRLWKDGAPGNEFFLVENRQKTAYDKLLPGEGLLVYHIDEAISGNSDESHPKVALLQADGKEQLRTAANRGDAGDPFPGTSNNTALNATSNPNTKSYGKMDTCVAITNIGAAGATMTCRLTVKCKTKELKEKDIKEKDKDRKDFTKERLKDRKEVWKEMREKPIPDKRPEKPIIDKAASFDKPPFGEKGGEKFLDGWRSPRAELEGQPAGTEARLAAIEDALHNLELFIGGELRPDLSQGALGQEADFEEIQARMLEGAVDAKRLYDTKPRES